MKQTQVRPKRKKSNSFSLSLILSRLNLSVLPSFPCLLLEAPPPGLVIDPQKGSPRAYLFPPVFTVRASRSLASHLRVASSTNCKSLADDPFRRSKYKSKAQKEPKRRRDSSSSSFCFRGGDRKCRLAGLASSGPPCFFQPFAGNWAFPLPFFVFFCYYLLFLLSAASLSFFSNSGNSGKERRELRPESDYISLVGRQYSL
ncbi:hypothetical protein H105_01159 [Trichophyton soudanense CBS 452.61]|uniref:Transmembrane protein n=1 Tax=Trichophyton soudanense CBS 452.61 TaxID=1215331 RepID=A0A022Y592_TRISD|nr:hypothetical protein H105_01159 [Trichophyton soudanense CBS 452.61]